MSGGAETVVGRLVLDDRMVSGRIVIEDGLITEVEVDDAGATDGRFVAPGFVDVHVHGWGGHDAMGDAAALDGMARALLGHGVTSFLPTAVTAPLEQLVAFADRVRASRSASTWRGRSSPRPGAVRTTQRTCGCRPTCRHPRWNRCSMDCAC
jgi:N-acetylglucosamine-6-phosphate deacetylase